MNAHLVLFPESAQQTGKIPHPVPKFWRIPCAVKTFCVFPNHVMYFGQIPDPENTLPDLAFWGQRNEGEGFVVKSPS